MLALIAIAVALAAPNVQAAGRGCFRPSYYSNQLFVIFLRKRSKRMKRRKLFLGSLFCCAWLTTVSVGSVEAAPQGNPEESQSTMSILMDGWRPFTSEEEIRIAGYLKREAEAYLKLLEPLAEPECDDESSTAEETDDTLQLIASDLEISLKEIITTLGLMERFFRQRPADYVRTAPLLWLTVAKNIALDEETAGEIGRLELVKSNWNSIVDVALPRLFSRILEPKLRKFLNGNSSEYALAPWDIPPL